ncbi:MAG: hypothetical protein HXS49_09755 [Theionarchaea archaeon]|nr:hypothetical protein [Theionarchaea archaeon]
MVIKRNQWVFHFEFLAMLVLVGCIFFVQLTREVPVSVQVDASPLQEVNGQMSQNVSQLNSLYALYELNLEELKSLSQYNGFDRLSSEQAVVGRVLYVHGEPFFYFLSLKEYLEAEYNTLSNSVSRVNKSYIRPLTPDIGFLADQFKARYPDRTDRALAILALIQNVGYDQNDSYVVKHPTVTLMKGGVCIDLVIACGALLRAADINCAILIFGNERHAAIGISDIDFARFDTDENMMVEFQGKKYLICETTSLRYPAGSELGSIDAEAVTLVIPYEFP